MAVSKSKFRKGLVIKPDSDALESIEGEIKVDSADNKIKSYLGGASREVVTNSQAHTLTNKTIDVDNNTVSNIEVDNLKSGVLNTSTTLATASNTQIPSALAVKTYVDDKTAAQNEASEIIYDPTASGLVATNVQDAIDEVDVDVDDLNTLSGVAKNAQDLGTFTGTTIPDSSTVKSALQALETSNELKATAAALQAHLDDTADAHDASAISNVPAGSISSTDVQGAINELDTDIQNHISDAVDAHDASAISVVPTGNLAADDVQEGLVELQGDIDTINTAIANHVTGPGSATDNALARFDATTGKLIQNSVGILSDAGILSGLTGLSSSGTVDSTGTLLASSVLAEGLSTDSATTGSNASLSSPSTPIVRLTNASLASISQISSTTSGRVLTIINHTGNSITINDNSGATAAERILTGSKSPIVLADEASLIVKYDSTEARWIVIGGTGSGAGQALDIAVQLTGTDQAQWVSGNNASFLGGGTLGGTFVSESASPLNGTSSYKYTQAAGSLNDYISSPAQAIALRFRGNIATGIFTYTYDGGSSDIEPVIYDVTNSTKLSSPANLLPLSGSVSKTYKVNVTIPSTCTQIRVGFQTKILNSGKILTFDDIQITSDTTSYVDNSNPNILTAADSFSTDTALMAYAGSGAYTLSTLENAPIGTYITFTYAASGNTRTQTTTRPTQTDADMNTNGMLLYTRAYNASSSATQPAIFAAQVGKFFKGDQLQLFKSSAKATAGDILWKQNDAFTSDFGCKLIDYNPTTGILIIDAGYRGASNTSADFIFEDLSTQTSGYVVINASKTPALIGVPQVQPRIATIKDEKSSGTVAGGFTSGSYQTRTLNTLVDPTSLVTSLASNKFTLPAGSYEIEAIAPASSCGNHKCRIQNTTAGSTAILGSNAVAAITAPTGRTQSFAKGIVTITTSSDFELQHRCSTNAPTDGFGEQTTFGDNEVYAQVKITKIK